MCDRPTNDLYGGHIVDISLNLSFWNISHHHPWLSVESQCYPLPGLINKLTNRLIRVKELSGELGEVKGKSGRNEVPESTTPTSSVEAQSPEGETQEASHAGPLNHKDTLRTELSFSLKLEISLIHSLQTNHSFLSLYHSKLPPFSPTSAPPPFPFKRECFLKNSAKNLS